MGLFSRRWSFRVASIATPLQPPPAPLIVGGMVLWYDPTQETDYADMDEVTILHDQSGNGWDATVEAVATGGPTYLTSGRNGKALIDTITGVPTAMETVGLNLQNTDLTLYVALSYAVDTAANQQRLLHSATGDPVIIGLDIDVGGVDRIFTSTTGGTNQSFQGDAAFQILTFRLEKGAVPTSNRIQIWRTLDGSGATTVHDGGSTLLPVTGVDIDRPTWFAQLNAAGHFLLAEIGDIILYGQAHSDSQREQVIAYLVDKWAIT